MRNWIVATIAIAAISALSPASADYTTSPTHQSTSTYMRVFGSTPPPQGFVSFCASHRAECRADGLPSKRFAATPALLSELDEVNRFVNTTINPTTDRELYGTEEHWTLPHTKGDCEDYVLLKRKMLQKKGWPASALLITVVRDRLGEGHAVLTARTDQGDFILDNKDPNVRLWHDTPYHYVMRQSYLNPMSWMSLDPNHVWPAAAPATSQSGKRWSTRAFSR